MDTATTRLRRSSVEKASKGKKSEKSPKIKKESSLLQKRKPVIAESDSEDEFIPPPKRNVVNSTVKKELPATPEKPVKPDPSPNTDSAPNNKHGVKTEEMYSESEEENDYSDSDDDGEESDDSYEEEFAPKRKKTAVTPNGPKAKRPIVTETPPTKKTPSSTSKKTTTSSASKKATPSAKSASNKATPSGKIPIKATPSAKSASNKVASSAKSTSKTSSTTKVKKETKSPKKETGTSTKAKGKKKEEDKKEVWKWWEEEPHPEGIKWVTLEHKGPYFALPYEPLPPNVKFYYDGKPMKLSQNAEEAATFFGKMLDHDYTKKDVFCQNFFTDWRKEMTGEESIKIKNFNKCDFSEINQYFKDKSEARKQMSKEEKKAIKEENEKIVEEYGWAMIDGHKEKIGNFKTEPPSLFRGRGDHPKQGKIKRRVQAKDVTINIGKKATIPSPPPGQKWKGVQHDQKVTWLASWTESVQGQIKYVMLNPTSRLKGEKDWAKYETARRLKECVDTIREEYTKDLICKEMRIRQRAVAMYFIDKLALRAGNEKDADESADTVGCCSLRVEHIKLNEKLDGNEDVVEFDFLGKDSIRYYNRVPVDHQVFKNLKLFMKNKDGGDDLFDRLNTAVLNKHLSELMPGLTAKVFRTYNASKTLQEQLEQLTNPDDVLAEKFLSYNRANRAVAILCNHQRAVPKTFDQQMTNLQTKIDTKDEAILTVTKEVKKLKKEAKSTSDTKVLKQLELKKNQLARLEEQHKKLEVQATDKEENKEIALGTSKLNYLDPRITVAWCRKHDVPMEKVYNRTQRDKFAWAADMADETFEF